jgi:hypothetical protein
MTLRSYTYVCMKQSDYMYKSLEEGHGCTIDTCI